ncbi:MAG: sodium:proton antiporter [Phycisphaerae bacterium]|nr:sodium:proton antiporter [Phycisphaerae bacterium]
MLAIVTEHVIEHATGIYIGLLLLACVVGILTKWFAHVPYTIALTLVGLAVGVFELGPEISETGFSKELIFFVMLPPLLFQGALHMELNRLMSHFWPILTFSVAGVLISTVVIGGLFYWAAGIGCFLLALLFGAMITPTDPVSVLALFRECDVPADLKYLVEGESLFNDGTGVVIFSIILEMIVQGQSFHAGWAVLVFVKVAAGGLLLGVVLGWVAFSVMRRFEDHLLENAICLVLAYGSFWLAEFVHVSGVIATVVSGLLMGNFGRRLSMEQKTRETVETFFESVDFLINSFLFILIGIELQTVTLQDLLANLRPLGVAVAALLISRAITVYPLYSLLNLVGTQRPRKWAHVLFWGGLRGSIPIALLLGLPDHPALNEYRITFLVSGFGVVFFSLVCQGLTMKPLLRSLKLDTTTKPRPAV